MTGDDRSLVVASTNIKFTTLKTPILDLFRIRIASKYDLTIVELPDPFKAHKCSQDVNGFEKAKARVALKSIASSTSLPTTRQLRAEIVHRFPESESIGSHDALRHIVHRSRRSANEDRPSDFDNMIGDESFFDQNLKFIGSFVSAAAGKIAGFSTRLMLFYFVVNIFIFITFTYLLMFF